jgi:uncharacterized protein (DUF1800 family)
LYLRSARDLRIADQVSLVTAADVLPCGASGTWVRVSAITVFSNRDPLRSARPIAECPKGEKMIKASLVATAAVLLAACGNRPLKPVSPTAAARFLEQASFGPTPESLAHVERVGFEIYLDEQFQAPQSPYDLKPTDVFVTPLQQLLFVNALTGQDQLRQRVAFALSQIFVISIDKVDNPTAFAGWLRMLSADAFGNYSTLLRDVTLSPAMGNYLDMANNDKPDPVAGTNPNENYAREILQLFSIGPVRLNPDGTVQLDARGAPVPAYTQETIQGLAHTFTGWTYPTAPGASPGFPNPEFYIGAMRADETHHDSGSKLLLRGVRLPAGQSAAEDLRAALDNIVQDANVGPFIGLRLIQRLVKSNPSPAYVARVADAFADNGSRVRGDLKAVVRAILLDPEARLDTSGAAQPTDGKLREPILFVTGLLRALGGRSDGSALLYWTSLMRQNALQPPSVFNYYPPDYQVPGYRVLGPEFKLHNGPAVLARANFVNAVISGSLGSTTTVDLSGLEPLAGDPPKLVDAIDRRLLRSMMSPAMRQALITAVASWPGDDVVSRVRTAVYLAAISSQYQVQL